MKENPNRESLLVLEKTTLISLQVFNRRRAGDVERLSIVAFNTQQPVASEINDEMYSNLSTQAKQAVDKYVKINTRGKLGRIVSILLTAEHQACMKLIIENRKLLEIPDKNPFVFAMPSTIPSRFGYLRACALMREFSVACGAKEPQLLRLTRLRKHMATKCLTFNLQENLAGRVHKFMSHSGKIHEDFYQQSLPALDIPVVANILEAIQGVPDAVEPGEERANNNVEFIDPEDSRFLINKTNESIRRARDLSSKENQEMSNDSNESKEDESSNKDLTFQPAKSSFPSRVIRKKPVLTKTPVVCTRWSAEEIKVLTHYFADCINKRTLPKSAAVKSVIAENKVLQKRTLPQVKAYISNQHRKLKNINV